MATKIKRCLYVGLGRYGYERTASHKEDVR